jgi:hypothetical protein
MNHDALKSKRFATGMATTLVGFIALLLEAFSDVRIDNPEIIVNGIVAVWLIVAATYGGEDIAIAFKSGARADKYKTPQ